LRPELRRAALCRALATRHPEMEAAFATALQSPCLEIQREARDLAWRALTFTGGFIAEPTPPEMQALRSALAAIMERIWQAAEATGDDMRLPAREALRRLGLPAVQAAVQALRDATNTAERRQGLIMLRHATGCRLLTHVSAPPVLALLNDPDAAVRVAAARVLGEMTPAAATVVPALVRGLGDPDVEVQESCAFGLTLLGAEAAAALPMLQQHLVRGDVATRYQCAIAFGRIDSQGKSVVPALTAALQDPAARCGALHGLATIGPAAKPALPQVLALFAAADDEPTLDAALAALASFGPAAAPAAPRLLALFVDPQRSNTLRHHAFLALHAVGPQAAQVPRLLKLLEQADDTRWYAVRLLGRTGSPAAAAIPRLKELAADAHQDRFARLKAINALAAIDPTIGKQVRAEQGLTLLSTPRLLWPLLPRP
jgi:HEAT repeat protein